MISLSCIEALALLNDLTCTQDELIQASGRGRTSGIGVNTYFEGGLVLDLGHNVEDELTFLPSEQRTHVSTIPLRGVRIPMPSWEIGICVCRNVRTISEDEEAIFFRATCPIPENESYRATYHAVFGVLAGALAHNHSGFSAGVQGLQDCAWKKAEIGLYGSRISDVARTLRMHGAIAVGMSSLGPLLFFTGENCSTIIERAKQELSDCDLSITTPHNNGRLISR